MATTASGETVAGGTPTDNANENRNEHLYLIGILANEFKLEELHFAAASRGTVQCHNGVVPLLILRRTTEMKMETSIGIFVIDMKWRGDSQPRHIAGISIQCTPFVHPCGDPPAPHGP